jgi:hypothetical protein
VDKSASAKKELIVKIELFVILPGLGLIVSAGTVRFRQLAGPFRNTYARGSLS